MSGSNATDGLQVADPGIEIGAEIELQVSVTEMTDGTHTGSRGALYLSAIKNANSLVTAYLDDNMKPVEYTPEGDLNEDYCFFKVYKIEVKSPSTAITGDDAVALRNVSLDWDITRAQNSMALFELADSYAGLTGYGATQTSLGGDEFYTFAADVSSVAANTELLTKWIAVRVDGGSLSREDAQSATGSPVEADFGLAVTVHTGA